MSRFRRSTLIAGLFDRITLGNAIRDPLVDLSLNPRAYAPDLDGPREFASGDQVIDLIAAKADAPKHILDTEKAS
jgi:hypothetical protein